MSILNGNRYKYYNTRLKATPEGWQYWRSLNYPTVEEQLDYLERGGPEIAKLLHKNVQVDESPSLTTIGLQPDTEADEVLHFVCESGHGEIVGKELYEDSEDITWATSGGIGRGINQLLRKGFLEVVS